MKNAFALFALAGLSLGAHGAGSILVTGIPRAASTNSGGSVAVDLWVDWSGVTGGLKFAGFKFDVVGHANGTLLGAVNTDPDGVSQGINHGTPSGSNLLDMGGGELPPSFADGSRNPIRIGSVTFADAGTATENYTVTLSIVDYVSPAGSFNVFIGASGTQSRSSYTLSTGSFHLVHIDIGSFEVIVPTPGALALLGLGSLVAGRRRR